MNNSPIFLNLQLTSPEPGFALTAGLYITSAANWKGGGGFRFCEPGPSLIRQDAWGNPVINAGFNPEMLAEALCKLEGFRYAPHPETFWMQG